MWRRLTSLSISFSRCLSSSVTLFNRVLLALCARKSDFIQRADPEARAHQVVLDEGELGLDPRNIAQQSFVLIASRSSLDEIGQLAS